MESNKQRGVRGEESSSHHRRSQPTLTLREVQSIELTTTPPLRSQRHTLLIQSLDSVPFPHMQLSHSPTSSHRPHKSQSTTDMVHLSAPGREERERESRPREAEARHRSSQSQRKKRNSQPSHSRSAGEEGEEETMRMMMTRTLSLMRRPESLSTVLDLMMRSSVTLTVPNSLRRQTLGARSPSHSGAEMDRRRDAKTVRCARTSGSLCALQVSWSLSVMCARQFAQMVRSIMMEFV